MEQSRTIEIEATFLLQEQGGRRRPVDPSAGGYRTHLVVQSPDVRRAILEGGVGVEDYLAVEFVSGPVGPLTGRADRYLVRLTNRPDVSYDELEPGATFTIREGGKVVGFGVVLRLLGSTDRDPSAA